MTEKERGHGRNTQCYVKLIVTFNFSRGVPSQTLPGKVSGVDVKKFFFVFELWHFYRLSGLVLFHASLAGEHDGERERTQL